MGLLYDIDQLEKKVLEQQKEINALHIEREELKVNKLMLLREGVDSSFEIERLKGEVERSRCCGNCELEEIEYGDNMCPHDFLCKRSNREPNDYIDYWTAKAPEVG